MSARPRPVTATFPPPPLLSPVHLRPTSRSPSPLNSTASLLSVLNHNSYETVPSSVLRTEDETFSVSEDRRQYTWGTFVENSAVSRTTQYKECWVTPSYNTFAKETAGHTRTVQAKPSTKELQRSKSAENVKQNMKNLSTHQSLKNVSYEVESCEVSGDSEKEVKDGRNQLSAWEQWIVQKAKEQRSKAEQELERQKKKLEEEEKNRKEKEVKKKKAEKVIQEWIKEHDLRKKHETEAEQQKNKEQEELKQKQKQTASDKAKAKYDEWMQKKAEEETKRKKEVMEKREKELLEKENRRKRSEEAFNVWVKKAEQRPRTAPHSYGYTNGKLAGYYDSSSYPVPSYINPVPWQPIDIPKPKPKPKKKQNFNRRNVLSKHLGK